jgi:hypothetical protein
MVGSSGLLKPVSDVMSRCQRLPVSTVNASTAAGAAAQLFPKEGGSLPKATV